MVRSQKTKAKLGKTKNQKDEPEAVIFLSSSDEEANEDLSLEIVKKARMREAKRKREADFDEFKASERARVASVIDLSSTSSDEVELVASRSGGACGGGGVAASLVDDPAFKRKKRKKKKKSKKIEEEEEEEEEERTVDDVKSEKQAETSAPVEAVAPDNAEAEEIASPIEAANTTKLDETETGGDGIPDNMIMRKYLRGPRYFDPPDCFIETCYNCNEEGHKAANCTSKKRKKPCFVCGSLDHGARYCKEGLECFLCKRKGHRRKDCPEKQQWIAKDCKICLRCGDSGHDMFSCSNDYAPEDLKEIKCYVCKEVGHLCCVDFIDTTPGEVSCYNCGQAGHYGVGCAMLRGETSGAASAATCYKCGEQGHYKRGCPKNSKPGLVMGESSLPTKTKKLPKEAINKLGSHSAPHDLNKADKKKNIQPEGKGFGTPKKMKQRGGWITDDPGDLPNRNAKVNSWRSPVTPAKRNQHVISQVSGGHISNSHSPWMRPKFHPETPSPYGVVNPYQHRFSASRFGNVSGGIRAPYHQW